MTKPAVCSRCCLPSEWKSDALPPSLTLEKLRYPHGSVPFNPQLAEPLYLTKYIERMGRRHGSPLPQPESIALLHGRFNQKRADVSVDSIRR